MDFSDDKKSSHGLMTQVSVWAFGWVLANTGAKISTVSLFTPNFPRIFGSMGLFSEISLVQHPFEPLKNGIREFSWNHLDSYFAKNYVKCVSFFLAYFCNYLRHSCYFEKCVIIVVRMGKPYLPQPFCKLTKYNVWFTKPNTL